LVAQDPPDGYYLESAVLQDSNDRLDQDAAQALVRRINGVVRAADQGFRPVHLRGRYTAPDGTMSVVVRDLPRYEYRLPRGINHHCDPATLCVLMTEPQRFPLCCLLICVPRRTPVPVLSER
jgi:hypothetical protein